MLAILAGWREMDAAASLPTIRNPREEPIFRTEERQAHRQYLGFLRGRQKHNVQMLGDVEKAAELLLDGGDQRGPFRRGATTASAISTVPASSYRTLARNARGIFSSIWVEKRPDCGGGELAEAGYWQSCPTEISAKPRTGLLRPVTSPFKMVSEGTGLVPRAASRPSIRAL
jgi:hypothetical protein